MTRQITTKGKPPEGEAVSDRRRAFIVAVVLGLVVGLLLSAVAGWLGEKADAAPADPQRVPLCNAEFQCGVANAPDGVNKARDGKMGRLARGVRYSHADADVILNKLMNAQGRAIARGKMSRAARLNRQEMWRQFRTDDNCLYKKTPNTGSGTWPPTARWSCQWGTARIPDLDLNSGDVRGLVCTGSGGIFVGIAGIAGSLGPPAWVGIGTAWTVCMFQSVAEKAADN